MLVLNDVPLVNFDAPPVICSSAYNNIIFNQINIFIKTQR